MGPSIRWITIAASIIVLAQSGVALAQELEGGEVVRTARIGLSVPDEIRLEKRRAARQGDWAWTVATSAAGGWDSNIHLGDSGDRQDSAVFEAAGRAEVLHYFNPKSRLRLRAEADAIPYTANSDVDDFSQKASVFYGQRFSLDLSTTLLFEVEHLNDDVTNSIGETLDRDFESWNYRLSPTAYYDLAEGHDLRIQYPVKRKDYDETSDLNSLDWWSHGPKLTYDWDATEQIELGVTYAFKMQKYDEEPASRAYMDEADTPDEDHYFHDIKLFAEWSPLEWLVIGSDVAWKRKDDRYRDYESYDAIYAEIKAEMIVDRYRFRADLEYQHRDYDERPADLPEVSGTLEYDRITFDLSARTQLTRNIATFAGYGVQWRDTNRSGSTSYSDYIDHRILVGVAWAM